MSLAVHVAAWACIAGGVAFAFLGSLGLLRLPDVFARVHGAGMIDTMGAALLLAGMALESGSFAVGLRLALILVLLGLTSPTSSYALTRAALLGGVRPRARIDEGLGEKAAP